MSSNYTQFVWDNWIYQYKKPILFYIRTVLIFFMTIGSGYGTVYLYGSTVERTTVWFFAVLFLVLGGIFITFISRRLVIDTLKREVRINSWFLWTKKIYYFENIKNTEVASHYHNGIYVGQNIYLIFTNTAGEDTKILVNQWMVGSSRTWKIIDELNDILWLNQA